MGSQNSGGVISRYNHTGDAMGIVTSISMLGYEPFPTRDVISERNES